MTQRYLNKNLRSAIEREDRFVWSFGRFRTYYTGFILRAIRGYNDKGERLERVVFTTVSIDGAREILEILADKCADKGIDAYVGWYDAVNRFDDYQKYGRFIGEPESVRF